MMNVLSDIVENLVASAVMLVFAILSFFVLVFVVEAGAGIAGVQSAGGYLVLSAAIIAAAGIISGIQH